MMKLALPVAIVPIAETNDVHLDATPTASPSAIGFTPVPHQCRQVHVVRPLLLHAYLHRRWGPPHSLPLLIEADLHYLT
jgi:hypothetical protein